MSWMIAIALMVGQPALAAPDATPASGEAGQHAGDHGTDGHGEAAGHGDGGHAPDPWADDNHNGTPNFLDGSDEHYANSWGHPVYLQWVFHGFNLLVLIAGLVYLARKPVGAALRERSLAIQKELEDSYTREHAARAKYQELESRLSGFEAEVARLREEAARTAESERREIIVRGEEAAARVRESAERTIRDETAKATRQLRAEAVDLAVKLAEDTLRNQVGQDDRRRLAESFLDALAGGKRV